MIVSEQSLNNIIVRLKNRSIITEDGHWLWKISKNKDGYGVVGWNKKLIKVHRLSAHLFLGLDLNSTRLALHKIDCHIRNCWNPDHLYVGNHQDNMRDKRVLTLSLF